MSQDPKWQIRQEDLIKLLSQQTDAGNALVIAGLVEDELQKLLLSAMRPLSNTMAAKLFEGYGPLSTFSAKIDISFAFGLIEKDVHGDLRIIKDIRNCFAHTTHFVFFSSPEIAKLCKKLSNHRNGGDDFIYFRTRALECINAIKASADKKIFESALQKGNQAEA